MINIKTINLKIIFNGLLKVTFVILLTFGYFPDGKTLVISDTTNQSYAMIYTLPALGGEPKLLTENGPSYWHGWSPDGKTITYTGGRDGKYDIYTISASGGKEKRLTDTSGNVCPAYSHEGPYIYFQSDRTGLVVIYEMKADGSVQVQMTDDECNNWWPHPSPDGRWVAFLIYEGDVEGQGSMNVSSWFPDSKRLAYVSHRMVRR